MSGEMLIEGGRRATLAVIVASAAFIALLWVAVLERVNHERADALERGVEQTGNLALTFEEQARRAIASVDQVLSFVVSANQVQPGSGLTYIDARTRATLDRALFANVVVTDRQGRVIGSLLDYSDVDVSDRDYFQFHRARADGGLFIGRPTTGRIVARTVVHFARRIDDASGAFGGIAVVAVDPAYFTDFYQRLALGTKGVVQLVRLDGVALARRHSGETSFGDDLRASLLLARAAETERGSFVSRGRVDGEARQQSYRVLADYGLVVSAGLALDELLDEARKREKELFVFAAGGTALLVVMAAVLLMLGRRQRAAGAALLESERRLQDMLGTVRLISLMLDRTARITYCNDYLLALTGWKREEVLGRNWFELFIPPEATGVHELFADLIGGRQAAWHHENEIVTRSGERRLVRWNNTLLRGPSGEVIGTASIGEDITDRNAAERMLREQLDELRRFQAVAVDRELRMVDLKRMLRDRTAA
jgi:PAS domain S-box-containing protein